MGEDLIYLGGKIIPLLKLWFICFEFFSCRYEEQNMYQSQLKLRRLLQHPPKRVNRITEPTKNDDGDE